MSKALFLFALLVALTTQARVEGETTRQLVWHDEFDGTGEVDWTRWESEQGFVRNEELQWYQPQNAYRLNGVLILEGRHDSIPNPRYKAGGKGWRESRPYAQYSSGSITTRHSYSFLYGRLEVRARIPATIGSWPAIWTMGDGMEWPSCGEVDLMEYYQVNGQPTILANAAWGNDEPYGAVWDTQRTPYTHFSSRDPFWHARFHIWRMDWDEHFIRLYLDDELLNEIDLTRTVNGTRGKHTNPFHKPMYILLDHAIGSSGGQPVPDTFPLRYEIDYVRVYQ